MSNVPYAMTIGGERVFADNLGEVVNPATETVVCSYPLATRADFERAVASAKDAFVSWSKTPLGVRQAKLHELSQLIEQKKDTFVDLLITEQGKSRAAAEWEINGCIHWCDKISRQHLEDEVVVSNPDEEIVTRYTPIGVVGAITPWNFPVLLAVWKIAPALLVGNTMVLKPSPYTPLCTLLLGELAQAVLPAGVLNVVSGGNELGQWITEHPDIGKVSFTGSTATGRRVMQSAASNLKRLTLELGGNDAAIVLPDVDPKAVAGPLFWAAFANSAQFCVACKRLYVHEDIYDELTSEMVAYAATVKMGNGKDAGTELGPLQNQMQYEKVVELLDDSKANGHRFLLGGELPSGPGYFVPVTLVDNPPESSRCVAEEAFGPILPILKYRDIEEVIARANDTPYGLAGSVWGRDVAEAERVARLLETGTVWINQAHIFSPDIAFGGHKQSGLGIENSLHGLAEYANVQTILRKGKRP
ncbi:aldehyde dehydrogenase family protein [Pseudomonas putida]|uniref:aldehyde dehydrogenase family protein n=1 Tax=Pseudomonas putida TaxID=303 RepID=UPI001EDA2528|nr:aldehyde dehydrogenase family protein [Pseudomonas putida]